MLLAATGMYAVMNYTTSQRLAEFAVRRALGAEVAVIISLVLRGVVRIAGIGTIAV